MAKVKIGRDARIGKFIPVKVAQTRPKKAVVDAAHPLSTLSGL